MSINKQKYQFLLIDGMNAYHRAGHAYDLGFFQNDVYYPTGAVFGFMNIVLTTWRKYAAPGCKLIICWDAGYKHRTDIYPEYKANRRKKKDAPAEEQTDNQETFWTQYQALQRLLKVAGWPVAHSKGFEADDVMATLAKKYEHQGRVAIYTMDGDLQQCARPTVDIISPGFGGKKDKTWNPKAVTEKWGFGPEKVAEIKGLIGDSGDNIPGCPGCGLVGAKKLITTYGGLSESLDAAQAGLLRGTYNGKDWTAKALTKRLNENADLVRISWELAKVVEDCPCEMQDGAQDIDKLREALAFVRFYSLLESDQLEMIQEIGV